MDKFHVTGGEVLRRWPPGGGGDGQSFLSPVAPWGTVFPLIVISSGYPGSVSAAQWCYHLCKVVIGIFISSPQTSLIICTSLEDWTKEMGRLWLIRPFFGFMSPGGVFGVLSTGLSDPERRWQQSLQKSSQKKTPKCLEPLRVDTQSPCWWSLPRASLAQIIGSCDCSRQRHWTGGSGAEQTLCLMEQKG